MSTVSFVSEQGTQLEVPTHTNFTPVLWAWLAVLNQSPNRLTSLTQLANVLCTQKFQLPPQPQVLQLLALVIREPAPPRAPPVVPPQDTNTYVFPTSSPTALRPSLPPYYLNNPPSAQTAQFFLLFQYDINEEPFWVNLDDAILHLLESATPPAAPQLHVPLLQDILLPTSPPRSIPLLLSHLNAGSAFHTTSTLTALEVSQLLATLKQPQHLNIPPQAELVLTTSYCINNRQFKDNPNLRDLFLTLTLPSPAQKHSSFCFCFSFETVLDINSLQTLVHKCICLYLQAYLQLRILQHMLPRLSCVSRTPDEPSWEVPSQGATPFWAEWLQPTCTTDSPLINLRLGGATSKPLDLLSPDPFERPVDHIPDIIAYVQHQQLLQLTC